MKQKLQLDKDFIRNDPNWLRSEQAKDLLLMIEDDIFENGNFFQRMVLFENELDSNEIKEFNFFIFWLIGFIVFYFLFFVVGFFTDYFTIFLFFGFFASIVLGLLSTGFVNSWSGIHYLVYKSAIKRASKKFATPEDFSAFLIAINLIYRQNKYGLNEELIKKEISDEIKLCYEGIKAQYRKFNFGSNKSKNALGKEFNKIFRNVKYVNENSFRAGQIKKKVDENGSSAKNSIMKYFSNR